jgi:hypothetical protein
VLYINTIERIGVWIPSKFFDQTVESRAEKIEMGSFRISRDLGGSHENPEESREPLQTCSSDRQQRTPTNNSESKQKLQIEQLLIELLDESKF